MSKTETGCTPKLVFNIQIEETRFTLSTLFSFHIFFADANASFRVALRWINLRARFKAIATFAARLGKVVVVVSAPVKFPLLAPKWRPKRQWHLLVTLVPSYSRLTSTLSLWIALLELRAGFVTQTGRAITVLSHVVVGTAPFAIWTVPVRLTV